MPQIINVPNYGDVEFPDDMSDEDIIKAIKKNALGYKEPKSSSYTIGAPSLSNLKENSATFGKGLLSGAADIGNTLINASTYIPRKIGDAMTQQGISNLVSGQKAVSPLTAWNNEREAGLNAINQDNSGDALYNVGRIGGNIAGTAGVGGLAGGVLKAGSRTPQAARLAESISSGGLTGANLGYKIAGGATQGALGSALIDPKSAGTGAAIGSAIPVAGVALPALGSGLANVVGGLRTNTGGQPLKTAALAGMQGGKAQQQVIDNMRGNVPLTDVIATAENKLSGLGKAASDNYKQNYAAISNDKSILNFNGIDKAIKDAEGIYKYKGIVKNEGAANVGNQISDIVDNWKKLDPAEYHTPEGLDNLKQSIGGILTSLDPVKDKQAYSVASNVYNSIKSEINQQAPTYAKVMKDYSQGMDEINEIRKTLSLSGKATSDTKLRKLQSVMRNNVNTNYGQRAQLLNQLEDGGGDITNSLAGQALNDWIPKGLGKIAAAPAGLLSYGIGGLPLAGLSLGSSSPRLMGELALKSGQAARYVRDASGKLVPATGAISAGLLNY